MARRSIEGNFGRICERITDILDKDLFEMFSNGSPKEHVDAFMRLQDREKREKITEIIYQTMDIKRELEDIWKIASQGDYA